MANQNIGKQLYTHWYYTQPFHCVLMVILFQNLVCGATF